MLVALVPVPVHALLVTMSVQVKPVYSALLVSIAQQARLLHAPIVLVVLTVQRVPLPVHLALLVRLALPQRLILPLPQLVLLVPLVSTVQLEQQHARLLLLLVITCLVIL